MIHSQEDHTKGKINADCSCKKCKKLRKKLRKRIKRRISLKSKLSFFVMIPVFKHTLSFEIKIKTGKI